MRVKSSAEWPGIKTSPISDVNTILPQEYKKSIELCIRGRGGHFQATKLKYLLLHMLEHYRYAGAVDFSRENPMLVSLHAAVRVHNDT